MWRTVLFSLVFSLLAFSGCDADTEPAESATPAAEQPADLVGGSPADPGTDEPIDPVVDTPSDPGTDDPADPGTDDPTDPVTVEPTDPGLPVGVEDGFTQTSCAAQADTAEPITAMSDASNAGQVILLPSETKTYSILLPESGVGYVTLEVPEWQAIIARYTHDGADVEILDPEGKAQELVPLQLNGSCPDDGLTETRTKFHKWGAFTLSITGPPNEEVWLMLIRTE